MVVLLFCCTNNFVAAQQSKYQKATLPTIFKEIEKHTEWQINYDAVALSDYTFSGKIDYANPEQLLSILLKDSPYSFELDGNYMLIFLPDKQIYKLCGYLKKQLDRTPIPFATIHAKGTNKGATSDENGYFSLELQAYKNQEISISYLGLKPLEFKVADWQKGNCENIYLQEDIYTLGLDLIIKSYLIKGISEGAKYGATKFEFNELAKNYAFQEQDILKATQLLPGITSVDESATNLNIRGSLPDQNLVIWEGATLYEPGHIFGLISSINPYVVEEVAIYKSVYGPQYENRVGGIIDISLSDKISNRFKGGLGTTMTESHAYLELPLLKNKLAAIVSGRLTTNRLGTSPTLNTYSQKIFQTQIVGEERASNNIGFNNADERLNFYDWNGKLLYQANERLLVEASYFSSHNNFSYFSRAGGDDLQSSESVDYESQALSTKMTLDWNKKIATSFFFNQSAYQNQNNALFTNNSETGFSYTSNTSNDIKDLQIGLKNKWQIRPDLDINLLYTYKKQEVEYTLSQHSNADLDLSSNQLTLGNFQNIAGTIHYTRSKLSVMLGLRNTYYQEQKKWFITPRLNAQYLLLPKLKFKFSAGKFYQFISQLANIGNKTINANTDLWILTNNESKEVLNARKIATGFIFNPKDWLIDIAFYQHRLSGISSLSTSFNANLNIEGTGSSKINGLDVLVKKEWQQYKFWLNYTLSQQFYTFPTLSATAFPANNDHRHNISLFNTYKWKNWSFSLTYQFRSGLPYSNPLGVEQYTLENESKNYYRIVFDEINGNRLTDYHRVDLGISYRRPIFKKRMQMEIACSLLNVFNRANQFSRDYFIADLESIQEVQVRAIEKFQLKRTPQLLFRIYWE
jgi:hypothetical protein